MFKKFTMAVVICAMLVGMLPAFAAVAAEADDYWKLVFEENFDGTEVDTAVWSMYNSGGHVGNGLRRPEAFTVKDGLLTVTAQMKDGELVSGGMAHRQNFKYGKFEFRVKADPDPDQATSAVVLTWPESGKWPVDGELDMYETLTNAQRNPLRTFIHYGEDNKQYGFAHQTDAKEWHVVAMEWEEDQIRMYVDGVLSCTFDDPDCIPDVAHHICIQLDAFKKTMGASPVKMYVDWVKIYQATPRADGSIRVKVDGETVNFPDQQPVIINDRTLVPLRAIFEKLGADVQFDEATETVTATKKKNTVVLKIGDKTATRNGETVTLDVPAQLINDRTMVPVRFVAEAMSSDVSWAESTQTVIVRAIPEPVEGRVSDTDKSVVYTGSWKHEGDGGFFGNTKSVSSIPGSYAEVKFEGTEVSMATMKMPHGGYFEAFIDGVSQGEFDTYSPSVEYQAKTFVKGGLTPGEHTLKILVLDKSNPNCAKIGNSVYVGIDFFDLGEGAAVGGGDTTPAAPQPSSAPQNNAPAAGGGKVTNADKAVTYTGTWNHESDSKFDSGTKSVSPNKDASAELKFKGTGVAVYTIKIPHGGIYEAFIDGVSQGKNDTYNPSTAQYNQKTFEKTGLSDGEHTIKLVVTGDANPSATGSKVGYVGLDYFLVSGGDGAAPASAATTPAAPATSGATTVAGGFSAEGSWQSSSLAGFIAANKTYYTNTKGAVAQWNPGVTEAASVTVSVYKLAHDSSIVQEYEIYHNGKVDKKSVNFKEGSSGWAELGTFDFAGKGDEYLKLTAAASSTRIAEAKFDVTSGANAGKSIVVAIDKQP